MTASLILCWTVVGMAVGFGAMYADFKAENRAAALGGIGALLFLFWSMAVVFLIIAAGSWPMYHLTKQWVAGGQVDGVYVFCLIVWFFCAVLPGLYLVRFCWQKGCRKLLQ